MASSSRIRVKFGDAFGKLSSSSARIRSLEKQESTPSIRCWSALFVVVVDSGDADPGCDSCVSGLTRRG